MKKIKLKVNHKDQRGLIVDLLEKKKYKCDYSYNSKKR